MRSEEVADGSRGGNVSKVCHITSAHQSSDDRIFGKECVSLVKAGYEVYLVAGGKSREEKGVHVIGLGDAPTNRFKRMTQFAKSAFRTAAALDCDVYHFHDPELLPYGLRLKRIGKKVIFDSHEDHASQLTERLYLPNWSRKLIAYIYHFYETHVIKRLDAVITPCTFNGKNIFENRAKTTCFIANYARLDGFYDRYNDTAIKGGYVCYTGLISEANGTMDLVVGASRAKVPLVLAGARNEFVDSLENLSEFRTVDYRGFVDIEAVIDILQHANIGVYVNRHIGQNGMVDTFGIKVYEFMAMGLPIIVDRTPYSEMVIRKYQCGICVEPEDCNAIAAAIHYLMDNPKAAKDMGQNGRRAVACEYNWSTQEKRLWQLYHDLTLSTEL